MLRWFLYPNTGIAISTAASAALHLRSGLGSLEGPAGIPILLRQLLRVCRPFIRNAALLESTFLLIRVALAWGGDDGGIHDLS
jgi:hypothetical protein